MDTHLIPEAIHEKLVSPNSAQPLERAVGGLSGALVFRCAKPNGHACLRRWPKGYPSESYLYTIHAAMKHLKSDGIAAVPEIYSSTQGATVVREQGYLWELTEWMPGKADYLEQPNSVRLTAATTLLAQIHTAWETFHPATQEPNALATLPIPTPRNSVAPSPAVAERHRRLSEVLGGNDLAALGHQTRDPWEAELVRETQALVVEHGPRLLEQLAELMQTPSAVHFVLRDIWSDHLLFTENAVTGVIDFGAARTDEPATDLARMLGSLEPFSQEQWAAGFEEYKRLRPEIDLGRVQVLDRASCLLSAVQWAKWMIAERKEFDVPRAKLLARWELFIKRLRWLSSSECCGFDLHN